MRMRNDRPTLHVIAVMVLFAGLALPRGGIAAAGEDTTPPVIEADFADNDVLPLPPLLTGAAADTSGVDLVRVAIRDRATLRWHVPGGDTIVGDATVGFPAELSDPGGAETTWSFDATALPPGAYVVFVMARDIHGNLALWHTVDGLRIGILVGTPESDNPVLSAAFGGVVSPGIDVGGTATDASGVAAVRVAVRSQQSGLWHLPSGATRPTPPETLAVLGDPRAPSTTWSYNLGPLPPGDYNVLVRGADIYNNAIWWYTPGMLRIAVTVDVGPPVLTADYSHNDVLPLPAALTGRAMDPTGVAEVRVAIRDKASLLWQLPDGSTAAGDATIGFPAVLEEPLGVDTAWSFDAPALGPGFYEVFVMAFDADGNLALWHTADGLRASVFFGTPEFDLPVVTAEFSEGDTIPSDGTLIGEATDASGVAAVRVAVRSQQSGLWHLPSGATRSSTSPPETLASLGDPRAPSTTWSYDLGPLPSGDYKILVRGADIYGNAIWWYLPGSLRIGVTVAPNLDGDLVAYYPFNGNANDESGNGNHGTVHGATLTEDGFGNPESAYNFDGIDDYISISSAAWLHRRSLKRSRFRMEFGSMSNRWSISIMFLSARMLLVPTSPTRSISMEILTPRRDTLKRLFIHRIAGC